MDCGTRLDCGFLLPCGHHEKIMNTFSAMVRSNIGQRLGLLLASFSLLAALLLGYLTYTVAREQLVERAQHTLLDTTRILSSHLQTGFAQWGRDATMLATLAGGLPLPGGTTPTAVQAQSLETLAQVFRAQLLARPGLLQIQLIGLRDHGLELVRLQRLADERIVRVEGTALQEKAHFPYVFETARLPTGGVYFTDFDINHEDSLPQEERAVFSVAAPVVQGTAVVAVVALRVDAAAFVRHFSASLPAPYGFYLANRWGDFLAHPEHDKAFAFDRGQRVLVQEEFAATAALLAGKVHEQMFGQTEGQGAAQIHAFVRMPFGARDDGRFLLLGLSRSMSAVLAQARELGGTIVKMIAVLALVAALLAAWVSRVVTGPLRAMVQAADAFSRGQPHGALPVERQDELGELARGFRDMEAQIGQQMDELNRSRDAMAHLAHHDPLTGLPNRRMFEQRLDQALDRARRSGRPCALVFVDLDDFKSFNDKLGHAVGDAVLQAAAQAIVGAVRQVDTVARLAGDEFTVLCENVDSDAAAQRVVDKLCQAFATPLQVGGQPMVVRASMGISVYPYDGDDARTLLASADAAMYRAKEQRAMW